MCVDVAGIAGYWTRKFSGRPKGSTRPPSSEGPLCGGQRLHGQARWRTAPGHKPSFPTRSNILSRSTYEWQVSGEKTEPHFGSTRPKAGVDERLLAGYLPFAVFYVAVTR